jgi:hypothetical protein
VITREHTNFESLSPFANSRLKVSVGADFDVALLFELRHWGVRSDFDFPVDDRALGDGDGACADLAANDRGIADLQLILDDQAP